MMELRKLDHPKGWPSRYPLILPGRYVSFIRDAIADLSYVIG